MEKFTTSEKIFNYLILLAVILLIPSILFAAGFNDIPNFLEQNLGKAGDKSVLSIIAFVLFFLTFMFGGVNQPQATLSGYLFGTFLIITAVEISFLEGFRNLMQKIPFLSVPNLNYLVGIFVILMGIFLSTRVKLPVGFLVIGIFIVPISFLILCNSMGWLQFNNKFDMSLNKGWNQLASAIDPKYKDVESVKNYVQDVHEDKNLTEKEKNEKILELQKKIQKMEEDQKLLDSLKKESKNYEDLLKKQEKDIKGTIWCKDAMNNDKMVKTFKEAVRPGQPCVRDYAVSLVKTEPGQYFDLAHGMPGKSGVRQICAYFTHVLSQWKYISDPIMLADDFFSPADRTIAVGLAGDCDDYAVINASFVEAIGGYSRIMIGGCSAGYHAWAEVLIGTKIQWNYTKKEIEKFFGKSMNIEPSFDKEGLYWLPLDWEMGKTSCADKDIKEVYCSEAQRKKKY